ncbi:MAG: NAD(P)-dependent oxidoreductase [Solirubrobacterales bacterium]|nr:NAD(P)-dependent oxidoreductase [Solirubrobacterales bacterium]
MADQTWVLTGAAGRIASSVRPSLAERVAKLRLVDLDLVEPAHEREESVVADLRDQRAVEAALVGANGVLHLGALADEADFHDLAEVNILGTYHVFEAARRTGAERVVFASTNRVTGFYSRTTLVEPEMPTRPDGFYAVSKIACEALGRLYSDKFGLRVASLRIGSFEATPGDERQLSTWLSPSDCEQAFLAAMTAPDLTYTAIYAVSRNSRRWWDLSAGEAVGFDPQDDAESHAADVRAARPEAAGPQGGHYASPDYSLDRQR